MTVLPPLQFGVLSFSSLFAMVNPFSAAPIFVQLTSRQVMQRKRTAMRASITALITLSLFASAGGAIFAFFGITVPAFQIAGGLLFLLSSLRVLQGLPEHAETEQEVSADPSVVPLGIPLIAGAGSISTVMMLAGQARGHMYQVALGSAILVNALITLAVLLAAPAIVARLGKSGQEIMAKVMGLLTAVIGVQFIINGTTAVMMGLVRH